MELVFLLKTCHPPIDIIDKFLKKYGRAKRGNLITTNPNGLLHKSNSFDNICDHYGYSTEAHNIKLLMDMTPEDITAEHLDQIQYKVQIDSGTDLTASEEFCKTVDKHNYIVESTALASSSQNGIAERPHCTLKD